VSGACDRIFERLRELGFEVSEGSFEPFEQKLPFIVGVAWEKRPPASVTISPPIEAPRSARLWCS
jgi:hypothetical protein